MGLITINSLKKAFGEQLLFDNLTLDIGENDRIGLVGGNGTGKTTIFKLLTGELNPDNGEIIKNRFAKLGVMEQHVLNDLDRTLYDEVLSVFAFLNQMENELEEIHDTIEHKKGDMNALVLKQHILHEQYEKEGGLTYKSRVRATLLGLGFSESEFLQPVKTLSGGQKSKLSLGKMLLCNANVLLLDEPTNHLDIPSVEWLEDFLKAYVGAYIVISHDRYFLDKVTAKTIEIENSKITIYNGNYSYYLTKKAEDKIILAHQYQVTQREIGRIEGIIEQQRRWNREKNIKTAESKQKVVDKLKETLVKPENEVEKLNFTFKSKPGGGNDVLIAKDLQMSFGEKLLFQNLNMHIKKGERVFLLGANGSGKTTLFKIILDKLGSISGKINLGTNIETGYYDQTQESLDYTKTLLDEVWDSYPKMPQTTIRNALAAFLFKEDDVFKSISTLSGGERARIALLKLMLSNVNFLLLDEPTNHLDINSRETLENAFASYDGTLFIISHDRFFINKMADKIYYLTKDGLEEYTGNYDYFVEKRKNSVVSKPEKPEQPKNEDYKQKKVQEAAKRRLLTQITKNEEAIETAEKELSDLKAKQLLEEYTTDYVKAIEIAEKIEEQKHILEKLYEVWAELQEQNQ